MDYEVPLLMSQTRSSQRVLRALLVLGLGMGGHDLRSVAKLFKGTYHDP
jgi:hypothetical protein